MSGSPLLACKVRGGGANPSPLLLRRFILACLAVACFSAGWACRGSGRGVGERSDVVVAPDASLSSASSPPPSPRSVPRSSPSLPLGAAPRPTDTLVVYIFANSDPEAAGNLAYFLRHGAKPGDGADYLVVVQRGGEGEEEEDDGDGWTRSSRRSDDDDKRDRPRPRFPPAVERALSFAEPRASVTVVDHDNECYDWGTFGWALKQRAANSRPYRYWVLVNSSVRGPFVSPATETAAAAAAGLPSASVPWHSLLTSRLRGDVHASGPVISCEPSPHAGDSRGGPWRANPHVQSWALALDAAALDVLRGASRAFSSGEEGGEGGGGGARAPPSPANSSVAQGDGGPLDCARDRWDAIWSGEMGSSRALLDAGMNLDCLLPRYQGVDWRRKGNGGSRDDVGGSGSDSTDDSDPLHDPWLCNQRFSPTREGSFDGLTLGPYDTMFVKYKRSLLEVRAEATAAAAKLSQWEDQRWRREREEEEEEEREERERLVRVRGREAGNDKARSSPPPLPPSTGVDVVSNAFVNDPATHKSPRHAALSSRGIECFDAEAYLDLNPDLRAVFSSPGAAASRAAAEGKGASLAAAAGAAASEALWSHATEHGQFELRPMRFRCSSSRVPRGILGAAESLGREGSMFGLGQRAREELKRREKTTTTRATTTTARATTTTFPSSSSRKRVVGDEDSANPPGVLWAFSDGRRARGPGGRGGSGSVSPPSRFRRRDGGGVVAAAAAAK